MTALTKPNNILSKETFIKSQSPQLEYEPDEKPTLLEEKIEIESDWAKRECIKLWCFALFMSFTMAMILMGVIMTIYQRIPLMPASRLHGFCSVSVPMINDMTDSYRVLPLKWIDSPELQLVDTMPGHDNYINALTEQLDLGQALEKIAVSNHGRRVDFIHDFNDNTTGILDDERCFMMTLDYDVVMPPELFASALDEGLLFDVSRLRANVQARAPNADEMLRFAGDLFASCRGKPAYMLRDTAGSIRKRSVDEPDADYIHFSGKHVLELKIDNLAELLALEQKNNTK
ncbi:uncharacterized protein LOC112050882 [Bicyclus anynana]|uniref:Integral membrane protein 2 n=1 Tax=Bicyclus anynana TaxID=110368 RepID=A0A6J1NPD5_BICAN|nr:uncharacterized protein LOC112050882 [Bicyclus anynana]